MQVPRTQYTYLLLPILESAIKHLMFVEIAQWDNTQEKAFANSFVSFVAPHKKSSCDPFINIAETLFTLTRLCQSMVRVLSRITKHCNVENAYEGKKHSHYTLCHTKDCTKCSSQNVARSTIQVVYYQMEFKLKYLQAFGDMSLLCVNPDQTH